MSPAQHQRVKALFIAAGRQDPAARAEFIHRECPDDAQVRAEVEALLRADDDPLLALKTPALGVNIGKTLGAALRAPATTEMPSRLGQYRILRVLGEGGMGMVYVAEQDRPRRTVALKVIHAGPSGRALLRRFEHEAELLGRLQHPGIAQIFEAGSAPTPQGSVPYIAMELIEGLALTQHVEQHSATTTQRLELIAKVCDAVQYAHQRGVIHRDLKPANILVDVRGQPKVLDFGVARASQGDANVTTMRTSMGQLIGTLPYMSPEQVLADPDAIDTRSDVYSLGVILYQVLTGRLPHTLDNHSLPEAARVIREDQPISLSAINRVFRGEVETIVSKALEKNPARRYQSASELADDIRRHLRGEPIQARQDSALYVLTKQVKRYRGLVAAVLAAILGLIAFSVYALWQSERNAALADKASLEASRARAAQADAERQRAAAIAQQYRADETSVQLAGELTTSNIERGRLLGARGDIIAAESLLWPMYFAHPEDPYTRWALWDLYSHQPVLATASIAPESVVTTGFAASPDGKYLVATGTKGETLLSRADNFELVASLPGPGVLQYATAFSPDSTRLYIGGSEGTIRMWHLDDLAKSRDLCAHTGQIYSITFNHDGTLFASCADDAAVIWDAATNQPIRSLHGHTDGVGDAAFSPDGTAIVTVSFDKSVRIWPALREPSLPPMLGHTERVGRVAWSPDSTLIASGGVDRNVRLWSTSTLETVAELISPNGTVRSLGFSPDGKTIQAGGWWAMNLWDVESRRKIAALPAPEWVSEGCFSADGKSVMALHGAGIFRAWDLGASRARIRLADHLQRATVAFTPDGTRLATTDRTGRARFFDPNTGDCLGEFAPPTHRTRTLCFHPTRPIVALGSIEGYLDIWDYEHQRVLAAFCEQNDATVHAAAFSRDGRAFAYTCKSGEAVVLETDTWRPTAILPPSADEALSVCFTSDSTALCRIDRTFPSSLWSIHGEHLFTYPLHPQQWWIGHFGPNSYRFLTGDWGRNVTVNDAITGQIERSLKGHLGLVLDVAFMPPNENDPSGTRIAASTAADGTVRLWDTDQGRLLLTLDAFEGWDVTGLAFSPDGSKIAASGRDNVTIFDLRYFDRHIEGNRKFQAKKLGR